MKNLKQTFIILIPVIIVSVIAIFYNPCIFGISFFLDICFLDLSHSLVFLWPTGIVVSALFYVSNFTILKNRSSGFKYKLAIIFMIIVPIVSYCVYLGSVARQEKVEQNARIEKEEEYNAKSRNIEKNGGIISISNLKEEYRYNSLGKIEYIDFSLDVASEMTIDTEVSLTVFGPPVGFDFFEGAKHVKATLNATPKKIVLPVHVDGREPLPGREYSKGPFPMSLYFHILSPEYKDKFGLDFISMGYAGENRQGWKWDYANGFLNYESPMLKTRSYSLSEFMDTAAPEKKGENPFLSE